MVRPSRAPASSPSSEAPRAKTLARDLGVSPALARAAEKWDEASAAFEAACADRHGCGEIDERYADLASSAIDVVHALLDDRTRAVLGESVTTAVAPYERGERRAGDAPEDDIAVAERACKEVRARAAKLARAAS
ncbi:MAG: hypothetical protein ACXWUG_13030 [Polyangiales bacterium]